MKRCEWMACVLAVAALAVSSVSVAQDGGEAKPPAADKPAAAKIPLAEQLDLMVKELKLTEAQQTAVKARLDKLRDDLAKWDKDNAEKLTVLRAEALKARQAKDPEAAKRVGGQLKELEDRRNKLVSDAQAEVLALLTPEQVLTWRAVELLWQVNQAFQKVQFTDEQVRTIRQMCTDAAKRLASNPDADEDQVLQKLIDDVESKVLTDKQRQAGDGKVRPWPRGGKPPAGPTQLPKRGGGGRGKF